MSNLNQIVLNERFTEKGGNIILSEIKINSSIWVVQIAKKLNVARRIIVHDLDKLKQQQKLKRVGPDKGSYWEIL